MDMRGLAVGLVLLASTVRAQDPACQVARLVIKAQTLQPACSLTGRMRFRAIPVRANGHAVDVEKCQTPGVSWGHSSGFAGLSPDSWYLWVDDLFPGDAVSVEAHLWVEDELFSKYATFRYQRALKR